MAIASKKQSVQKTLFSLLLVVVLPILGIQGYIHYDRFKNRRAEELRANLELARAVGLGFENFVKDILRQELAIGLAATGSASLSKPDLIHLLSRSSEEYIPVKGFHWVSPQGRVLASNDPEAIGMDLSERDYMRELVSGREWAVSDLVISKVTGRPVFTISRAIRDNRGKLLGMVIATVEPNRLNPVLAIERAAGAGVSLLDRNGVLVARHPVGEYTWEQRDWKKRAPQVKHALKGEEITITIKSDSLTGKERLVAFAPVPSIGWVAAAGRPQEEAMRPVVLGLIKHLSLFLLVTIGVFAFALTLSRRISGSIITLRDHALALGQGEPPEIQSSTLSEVQEVASAFNEMARKVQDREAALRDSERRYRRLVETASEGIWQVDAEFRSHEVNDRMAEMLGCAKQEIIGKPIWEFTATEDLADARDRAANRQRGLTETYERRLRRKDGSTLWVSVSATPLRDAAEKIIGAFGMFTDITERKRAEVALRESEKKYKLLSSELDLRVQERTAELERKTEELQNFAFIASHDLNEPLRKIQNFGSLLTTKSAGHLTNTESDYISRMTQAADRMRELLDALLAYSRVETRGEEFRPTNLSALVRSVMIDLEVAIREAHAQIQLGNLPILPGDPLQLRQVFQNLISNALKYRRSDFNPVIHIYAEEGEELRIFVEDNGIGFDEKYLEKIFQPFQRLHGKHEYSGTGIGLAICRKVVERHGGAITARSTPGEGSTFIVTLPVHSANRLRCSSQQPS